MVIFKSQTLDLRDEPAESDSRRVITISRKKWGKSAAKTEKIIRDAIPKPETISEIDSYLEKARSVTPFDLAKKFGIRMSVARRILREKESVGILVPYIRESGFVVYSTPSEIAKREVSTSVLTNEVFDEIAATKPRGDVIDDDMEAALTAASSAGTIVKPSKLTRKRRESGEKKERKETLPEVVVEPLEGEAPKVEEEKAKKPSAKKPAKKDEKKPAAKKPAAKKPAAKKAAAKKPATKKAADKKPAAKKPATKKAADKKPAAKKPATKKAEKKAPAKKAKKPEISEIAGVGPKTVDALREGGFKTVAAISKADPAKLAKKVDGVSEAKAKQFIESAKKLVG